MNIATVNMRSDQAEQEFVAAIRDTGFAVLKNPPVSADRLKHMAETWLEFFLGEEKWQYPAVDTPTGNTSGYIPPQVSETAVGHDCKDLKEFFHIAPGSYLPERLNVEVWDHMDEAFALGGLLLGWLDRYCTDMLIPTLRGNLAECLSREVSLLRVLHYPPLLGDEPGSAVRAAPHEDINLITVLPVSEQSGLQILTREKQWLDVPGKPGDIVINAGDMLQEATGGYLPSTTHRVINPADPADNCSRVAIPYFLAPNLDTRLSDRYTAGEYLNERLELLAR